ncbi:hypothetical protein [Oxalicibacterium solurbis]|uniref:Uncharacterized protein n=1 Tax=Oxalicibacterium solurbis TaxID=69280 RepID=A0A8J3F9S2_9BURK|nr:hypothetical protein [Oxalicibacterium solurbis]GGI54948.1 hypothetical protein GCM10011430_21220 [Oxalicibacterium solurbis]
MLETTGRVFASVLSAMVTPLAEWLAEKFADRFGRQHPPLQRIAVQMVVFGLAILPALCVALLLVVLLGMLLSTAIHLLTNAVS